LKLHKVTSWHELVQLLDELDGWAFRGERSAQWDLLTSLARRLIQFCPDPALWPAREARAMRIFRRKAHNFLTDRTVLDDNLRCLAMMQHHGAPTRLLDFTKSPYVAAFFAFENATDEAALFALDTPRLWSATPSFDPQLTRDRIDPRSPANFARYFAGNDVPVLWVGEPSEMDHRLLAQSGLFVVPGVIQLTLEQILAHYDPSGSLLMKIVLPRALREEAMHQLYRMNITYSTLFPDIEGLARSVAYELEVLWQSREGSPVQS
jgi:hypothetical protein